MSYTGNPDDKFTQQRNTNGIVGNICWDETKFEDTGQG